MKLRHIAAAAALAAAGSPSFAVTTFNFHLSGSSALQKVVAKAIANNCSSLTTYSGLLGSPAAGVADNANGQSQTLYVCTVSATSTWGAAYQNNILNIFLNTQGSAYGVFPVAYGLSIPFIDPASCSGSTCNNVTSAVPDAGLSDLEPTMFNDLSNHPVDPSVGGTYNAAHPAPAGTVYPTLFASFTKVTPSLFKSSGIVAAQTFGLAVNDNLLAALQADQGLSSSQIPTVSSSAFETIYSPGYSQALGNWTPLLPNGSGNVNNQVNICARLPGSGTRASAQAFFLQAPFSPFAQSFATAANDNTGADTTISQTIGQNNSGTYEIGEYDNSGGVTGCLTTANGSGGYAIGLLSTDRAAGSVASGGPGYTFVNLDGSVPNTTAAKIGKYQWVYEAFYQVSTHASDQPFAIAFGNSFKTPANINALGAPSTNGVMATVNNCTAGYSGVNAVCTHVTRGGNSKAILQYAQ
jgi:hypothetical protein